MILLDAADGAQEVRVFLPEGTPKGGVIFCMDAFGLRPELDGMAARYAAAGYATFLPDLYYRLGSPRFPVPGAADDPLDPAMAAANTATTVEMTIADTSRLLDWAARTHGVRRFGAVGYCMGARHALGAAATHPAILAAACLHGGRMVWDGPNSPHRYIPQTGAELYFGFAANDETCPDAHQAVIERTIAESGARATTEHFAAAHGWTFPTRWCHDRPAAEHAIAQVLSLFARNMAGPAAA